MDGRPRTGFVLRIIRVPGFRPHVGRLGLGKSLSLQSHGQSILSFFKSRYAIKGLYFLDEPETALSPKSQVELLELMKTMGSDGRAQFIAATHSPILLSCPGAVIYSFDHVPVRAIPYRETVHFKLYKRFLENIP
jgi:predicted ATPase